MTAPDPAFTSQLAQIQEETLAKVRADRDAWRARAIHALVLVRWLAAFLAIGILIGGILMYFAYNSTETLTAIEDQNATAERRVQRADCIRSYQIVHDSLQDQFLEAAALAEPAQRIQTIAALRPQLTEARKDLDAIKDEKLCPPVK